jgi:hypothetical protein
MKTNSRNKTEQIFKGVLIFSLLTLFATSCLKDDTEELIAAHNRAFEAMKVTYGMTEANLIGDGIYLRFDPIDTAAAAHPSSSSYIVVDLEGYNSEGTLFAVTDAEVAEANDAFRSDLVYGPIQISVYNTFTGFFKAVQKMPEGSSATMLFPYDQAFGGYEPIAYRVKLYKVIADIDTFRFSEFEAYKNLLKDSLGITENGYDTIPGFPDVYSIITSEGTSDVNINYGDSATIELHAYYVETDPTYVSGFPGRCFFPINNSGDIITFDVGTTSFPISELINSLVPMMKIGERRELVSPAKYVYGDEGFVHPYVGIYIVPPAMDIHYSIELISYENNSI